jgi:uncharacterized delta-60 repeat protein
MATAAAPPPAPPLSWATFALTETRWLVHALGWSVVLWAALLYLPWLFYGGVLDRLFLGFGVVVELAILAALATAYTAREAASPPAPTVLRYALVDAPFVALTAPWIIVPLHVALNASGLVPLVGGYGALPILPIGVFVCAFYAALGAIGHARARGAPRQLPVGVALAVVAMLAVQSYQPAIEHFSREAERDAGVAKYESATGKKAEQLEQLQIGNSLHGFDHRVGSIEVDSRGRLVVLGMFSFYAGRDARGFVRLTPDGRLDPTFAKLPPGDPIRISPWTVRIADDGTIITLHAPDRLARVGEDGAPDVAFRPDVQPRTAERQPIEHLALLPDGSILLNSTVRWVQAPDDRCILRVDRSGARDAAFEAAAMQALYPPQPPQSYPTSCSIQSITPLASGQVLVVGSFPSNNHMAGMIRLNADGTLDPSYRVTANLSNASMTKVTPNGEVFLISYVPVPGSSPVTYRAKWMKLLATGEVDPAFAVPEDALSRVEALAIQPDGKPVVAGSRGPGTYGSILRLTPAGRLDPTFGGAAGTPRVDGFVIALTVQPDGRIIVGGEFREFHHGKTKVARHNIVRLNADGSLDRQFEPR